MTNAIYFEILPVHIQQRIVNEAFEDTLKSMIDSVISDAKQEIQKKPIGAWGFATVKMNKNV